jgi:beta-phosphoglucomutase
MLAIGVGNRKSLPHADVLVETLENLDLSVLKSKKDGDIK